MYNFFNFIKKYNFVILFLLVEILCFVMIVQNLPFQNRKMSNVFNGIAGSFYEVESNLMAYLSLKAENDILAEHNALLMKNIENTVDIFDSVVVDTPYIYIAAKVVKNDIYHTNNYMVLDKGRLDGVENDMGVVCDNGIVGKVANTSNHYCMVISMLHPYSIVSARLKDNQHLVNVRWDNGNYRFGVVEDIPTHLVLNQGDTVVTSGYSSVFPPDVTIGTIEEMFVSKKKDFNTAKIRFSTNFSTLRHVYIAKNIYKSELDSLAMTQ